MFIKFDKPKTNSKGRLASSGSSSAFVNYLGKEDEIHIEQGEQPEQWFSGGRDECHPAEVRASIDSDHQGIGRNEGKFATGSINPTEEEWKALGNTEADRLDNFKSWIQKDFNQEFAGNFKKLDKAGKEVKIEPENIKMYFKVEQDRYHSGTDQEVKLGLKLQGEPKEGFNVHCHFIVARKTTDGRNRISPTTNNRKEFDRDRLTLRIEQSFDQKTGYERPLKESYQYMNTMKNGNGLQKSEMLQKAVKEELHTGVLLKIKDLDKLIAPEKILLETVKSIKQKLSRDLNL
jgi:hypothetical protein